MITVLYASGHHHLSSRTTLQVRVRLTRSAHVRKQPPHSLCKGARGSVHHAVSVSRTSIDNDFPIPHRRRHALHRITRSNIGTPLRRSRFHSVFRNPVKKQRKHLCHHYHVVCDDTIKRILLISRYVKNANQLIVDTLIILINRLVNPGERQTEHFARIRLVRAVEIR